MFISHRAEDAHAKSEKEKRMLQSQLQMTQDDFMSEKDARQKIEKERQQLNEVNCSR